VLWIALCNDDAVSDPVTDEALASVVAIDGPAGTGKSTVARRVAEVVGLDYLDTGAMYRGITFAALRTGVDPDDRPAMANLVTQVEVTVTVEGITVDGTDASIEIRGPEVTRAVSLVAANPEVRAELVSRQREWIHRRGGGVLEGRDIATVVAPQARVKVFLTADAVVRAQRRGDEVRNLDYEEVAADLARRDALDQGRDVAPLVAADGAVVIDTTDLDIEDVVDQVVALWRLRERSA
jgi:cytidylate kinase